MPVRDALYDIVKVLEKVELRALEQAVRDAGLTPAEWAAATARIDRHLENTV